MNFNIDMTSLYTKEQMLADPNRQAYVNSLIANSLITALMSNKFITLYKIDNINSNKISDKRLF